MRCRQSALPVLLALALLAGALVAAADLVGRERQDLNLDEARAARLSFWDGSELAALQEPADAMLARQLGPEGAPPAADVYARAAAESRQLAAATAAQDPAMASAAWELRGPTDIGGRVLDVVVDPAQADRIFVAAASGGVWRSDDAGGTFTSVWPDDLTQAIGALAMTADGVLFAGTGETGPGGGSLTYGGTGVYRSADRGATWELVGLEGSSRIGRIVVHPTDPQTVYVAASGPLFAPGGERGLYRSSDGGETWDLVLEGDNDTTGAVDLAFDPNDPELLYAATWDHQRTPDQRLYTGPGSGVYRSTDGGDTWARIGNGTFGPNSEIGRIGLAVGPDSVLYAMSSGTSGVYAGFYVSTDGGATFTPRAHPLLAAQPVVYGWWFGRVWVDPFDADTIYVAGLNMIRSTDGGADWGLVDSGTLHADQHAMAWDVDVPGRVYIGNDGGVYRSDDNGVEFTFASYQPFSQLYGMDVDESDPDRLVAGLQDNGVNRNFEGTEPATDEWNGYVGGDGEESLINPQDNSIVYGCSQYGACEVSFDGGDRGQSFGDEVVSTRKNWYTPIEFDPLDPSTLYSGGEFLNRSTDDAQTWEVISPDLSDGPGGETNPLFRNYGTLTAIAPAPAEVGTIYAGTDDGNLWFTHDGGGTWTEAESEALPDAWITRVTVDPDDPQTAYATYSGFRSADEGAYVVRTTDGGATWTDVSGDLPRAPLNDVLVLPDDVLVVGSDVGVFASRDGGASWLRVGDGLPLAPVHDLRHHEPSGQLFAATFGRSSYSLDLEAALAGQGSGQTPPPVPTPAPTATPAPSPSPPVEEPSEPPAEADLEVRRLAGPDRVATAVEVSRDSHPDAAATVVLARADDYPDALAGAPLAAEVGGPVLLTPSDGLAPGVAAEVRRLGAQTAVLLGGPEALSPEVEEGLRSAGVTNVERVGGATRFETAAQIAARLDADRVYVALGRGSDGPASGFADALAVGPVAAAEGAPILLVEQSSVPPATASALDGRAAATIVGGTAAVSESVSRDLAGRGLSVDRAGGADRYETAAMVAARGLEAGASVGSTWLATGAAFPDALVAGAAVARDGGVLLLADPSDLDDSSATASFLGDRAGALRRVTLLGGPQALSEAVADDARALR